MTAYLIIYDLNRERENYDEVRKTVVERIQRTFPTHWRPVTTTWIVETNMSALKVINSVVDLFDDNDRLFVVTAGDENHWFGKFSEEQNAWLDHRL